MPLSSKPLRFPPAEREAEIWHYTNVHGFAGMIDSGKLWASSAASVNDTSELRLGIEAIRAAWMAVRTQHDDEFEAQVMLTAIPDETHASGLRRLLESNFMISASKSGDSLNQWMHYAEGTGFAVRFDPAVSLGTPGSAALVPPGGGARQVDPGEAFPIPGWRSVRYSAEQAVAEATDLVADLAGSYLGPNPFAARQLQLMQMAVLVKDSAFADEREIRHVFGGNNASPTFRVRRDRLVSYVEVSGPDERLPILAVRCGPGTDDATVSTVTSFLRSKGYYDVKVDRSEIPLSR
jgi:hypothetical protein